MSEDLPKRRKEAIELKTKYYFTGKSCKRGHIDKRQTSNGGCLSCNLSYYRENKEEIDAYKKEHKNKNKERYKQVYEEYYIKNKDKIKQQSSQYAKNKRLSNPEKTRQYKNEYRKKFRKNKKVF